MKKIIPVFALSFIAATMPLHATAEETAPTLAQSITKKVTNAIAGNVASLLSDAIFGSSGQTQYATLSEESLRKIEDIVNKQLVKSSEYDLFANIDSLGDTINYYHASVTNNNPDYSILDNALIKANDVVNHQAFNQNYNPNYYYLADSYSVAGSLAISVYTERYLQGYISAAAVSDEAHTLANKLEAMVNVRKSMELPLFDHCVMISSPYDPYERSRCTLETQDGHIIYQKDIDSSSDAGFQTWDAKMQTQKEVYYQENYGVLDNVIADWKAL
ncbi:hypothetical protein [Gallaecimonas sp. GXIMD1310]|uniref:hypothetical protein n=1 Tax=Gallaecimonas sp. GXIMD1310 TaxID=3131926 RepID=UPI0032524AE0